MKFDLRRLYKRKSFVFVSLLFMVVLVSSCFAVSFVSGAPDIVVGNEFELVAVINGAVKPVVIALDRDITLTEPLVIPVDKDITLTCISTSNFFKLVGGDRARASNEYNYPEAVINVEGSGVLRLDGIVVTCVGYTWNKVVRVDVCGTLILYNGEISGNSFGDGVVNMGLFEMSGGKIFNNNVNDGYGGGVYNSEYGTFSMSGGEISNNAGFGVYNRGVISWDRWRDGIFSMSGGVIRNNNCGGVHNSGNFSMSGGKISNNTAGGNGGGVQNINLFNMLGGEIFNNKATNGGGVYNYPDGNFSLSENGVISNNKAEVGGGVYNAGTFNRRDGAISGNAATLQYDDIYSPNGVGDDCNGESSNYGDGFGAEVIVICVSIIVVLVGVIVIILLRSKR